MPTNTLTRAVEKKQQISYPGSPGVNELVGPPRPSNVSLPGSKPAQPKRVYGQTPRVSGQSKNVTEQLREEGVRDIAITKSGVGVPLSPGVAQKIKEAQQQQRQQELQRLKHQQLSRATATTTTVTGGISTTQTPDIERQIRKEQEKYERELEKLSFEEWQEERKKTFMPVTSAYEKYVEPNIFRTTEERPLNTPLDTLVGKVEPKRVTKEVTRNIVSFADLPYLTIGGLKDISAYSRKHGKRDTLIKIAPVFSPLGKKGFLWREKESFEEDPFTYIATASVLAKGIEGIGKITKPKVSGSSVKSSSIVSEVGKITTAKGETAGKLFSIKGKGLIDTKLSVLGKETDVIKTAVDFEYPRYSVIWGKDRTVAGGGAGISDFFTSTGKAGETRITAGFLGQNKELSTSSLSYVLGEDISKTATRGKFSELSDLGGTKISTGKTKVMTGEATRDFFDIQLSTKIEEPKTPIEKGSPSLVSKTDRQFFTSLYGKENVGKIVGSETVGSLVPEVEKAIAESLPKTKPSKSSFTGSTLVPKELIDVGYESITPLSQLPGQDLNLLDSFSESSFSQKSSVGQGLTLTSIQESRQKSRQGTRLRSGTKQTPVMTQAPMTTQELVPDTRLDFMQIQRSSQKLRMDQKITPRITPRLRPPKTPIINVPFSPAMTGITPPRLGLGKTPLIKRSAPGRLFEGFNVFVRKNKRWLRVSDQPLEKRSALALGSLVTRKTARASFKIEKSSKPGKRLSLGSFEGGQFYKKNNVFIERSKYRIDTPGELREITFKGLKAKKRKRLSL